MCFGLRAAMGTQIFAPFVLGNVKVIFLTHVTFMSMRVRRIMTHCTPNYCSLHFVESIRQGALAFLGFCWGSTVPARFTSKSPVVVRALPVHRSSDAL